MNLYEFILQNSDVVIKLGFSSVAILFALVLVFKFATGTLLKSVRGSVKIKKPGVDVEFDFEAEGKELKPSDKTTKSNKNSKSKK